MLAILIGSTICLALPANAETQETSGYSVSPVFSIHQSKGIENFFDIRWTPKATDEFGLRITNNSDENQTYKIQVNKARTNKNGIIDYSDASPEDNQTKYKLTEMIKIPKEISVEAKSSQEVRGTLTFNNEDFNGILMAGIHVAQKQAENSKSTVSNTVAYNTPFVVRGNQDKRPVPKIELKEASLEKFASDLYTLDTKLTNQGPNLLKEVQVEAEIEDAQGEIINTQKSLLDITPETTFLYPIKLPKKIKPGTYQLHLNLEHSKENKWHFSKTFTISKEEVKKIQAVAKKPQGNKGIYLLLLMLLVLIILLLTTLLVLKKKPKVKPKAKKRKKKQKQISN